MLSKPTKVVVKVIVQKEDTINLMQCALQGLYMLLVPTTSVGYDAEKEERAEQEAKMAKISAIEEAKERWKTYSRVKINQNFSEYIQKYI